MSKSFFLLLIFVAGISCCACAEEKALGEWGGVTNNLQMSIGLKDGKNEITNGQFCILEIRYRNVSTNETINVLRMNWVESDGSYSFVVVNPSGKDISPNFNKPFGGSATTIVIGPGQIKGLEYNLSGVCKIDEIGTYKIIAKKWIMPGSQNKMFQTVSNPLMVKVVPAQ